VTKRRGIDVGSSDDVPRADDSGDMAQRRQARPTCCAASPTDRLRGFPFRTAAAASAILRNGSRGSVSAFADPRCSGIIALDQQAETAMVDLQVPVEGVALDALDAFLSSDQSPSDSMMLSDLDGFLTAIAIGPELIMPSEWLPMIWGDDEPVFTDEAEMQAVLGGILSRYNQIRHEITNGTFEPILWSDADGTTIGTDWAEGFMQGVALRATKWERLFRSEDGAGLIFPILALCGDENGESLLGLGPEDEDRIAAAALLPGCAMAIDDYWRQRKSTHRVTKKPRRNDPCPCGSGNKFKKCCGRSAT
jgi:uncharacterized protein